MEFRHVVRSSCQMLCFLVGGRAFLYLGPHNKSDRYPEGLERLWYTYVMNKLFLSCLILTSFFSFQSAHAATICNSSASDVDGDGWGWEDGASCQVTADTRGAPTIVNGVTGEPVNLSRLQWNNEDLGGQTLFDCDYAYRNWYGDPDDRTYFWGFGGTSSSDSACNYSSVEFLWNGTYEVTSGCALQNTPAGSTYQPTVGTWNIENGLLRTDSEPYTGDYPFMANIEYAEIREDGNGINIWREDGEFYYHCSDANPTGHLVEDNNQNDDLSAPCVDSDGDGWGWDGTESCQVANINENTSTDDAECLDPDGDGWGWDGTASCLVGDTIDENQTDDAECIDTDGDGWGWDGSASCLIN